MSINKRSTINTRDFEIALSNAMKDVDNYKHATSAAKEEMRKTLLNLKNLITYKEDIEVPEFMRWPE